MSPEERREVRLGPKLRGNVIEADPRFAALKRRIQERKDFEKTKRKRKREAATETSRLEITTKIPKRKPADPNLKKKMKRNLNDFSRFLPPRPASAPANLYGPNVEISIENPDFGTLNPIEPKQKPGKPF